MTTVSKPIMTVANKIANITAPSLKIREEREQTKLQEFIAKISLILHNLFTTGEFNIDLDDDSVNKVILEIAVQCKQIIDQYNINPEDDTQLDSKLITVEGFPSIQIKFEIKDNKLNVTLIESDQVYYFPDEELLLSIDLTDKNKIPRNLKAMDKVLSSDVSPYKELLNRVNTQVNDKYKFVDLVSPNSLFLIFTPYANDHKEEFTQYLLDHGVEYERQQKMDQIDHEMFMKKFYISKLPLSVVSALQNKINPDFLDSFNELLKDPGLLSDDDLPIMQILFGVKSTKEATTVFSNVMYIVDLI
jgi:hypothetical protein